MFILELIFGKFHLGLIVLIVRNCSFRPLEQMNLWGLSVYKVY